MQFYFKPPGFSSKPYITYFVQTSLQYLNVLHLVNTYELICVHVQVLESHGLKPIKLGPKEVCLLQQALLKQLVT